MRLTPGAYSRRTADDKLETLFNVAQGTGSAFRVRMEPSTGVFYLRRGTVSVCRGSVQDGGMGILLRLKDCPAGRTILAL
jgi:hypothetical protein